MTVSIFSVLATLPSGVSPYPLNNEELTSYLQNHYKTEAEADRNKRHAVRDDLYRDGGLAFMTNFIGSVFTDRTVRELRQKWVPYARFNNAIKRIVNELSTVYSEPARRLVSEADPVMAVDDEGNSIAVSSPSSNNVKYQALLDAVRINERAVEWSRLLTLHRALLVGFRIRQKPDGTREPVLDIATPANVRAITHPNDDSLVVAWLVRTCYRTARPDGDIPYWTLWTDHESLQLREDLSVIGNSHREHGLGVNPWVPVALGPTGPGFWPGNEGEDLVAAHVAIWFNNVLLLKESKSATKQTIIQGDGTALARGQSADSEVPGELADGQNVTTVDMSMDLELFRSTTDHILRHTAQNYGLSPALIEHQGVQSAEARELMRLPLREIRRQQQGPLRIFEHNLATVMSAVTAIDHPEMHFTMDGWRIEFAESETPLDPLSEMTLYEKRRQAGFDSPTAFVMRKMPGMDKAAAWAFIAENANELARHVDLMKDYLAISGALGANTPDDDDDDDDDDSDPEGGNVPPAQDSTES